MKLEKALNELETLVEYGVGYLMSRNPKAVHPLDILPEMNQNDILVYAVGHLSTEEILDELDLVDDETIDRWVRNNRHFSSIGFDEDDICEYVKENIGLDYFLADASLGEWMEANDYSDFDVLDYLCEENVREYAESTFDMVTKEDATEFVRENYTIDEVYADDFENCIQDHMDDMSFIEIMECKGWDIKDICGEIYENYSESDVVDALSDHYAVAQFVRWNA